MPQQLNVLLTNSADIYGGGEFFVYELAKALHERKHNVHVVCRPDNLLREKCEQANISVLPLAFPSNGKLIKMISELRRMIQEKNIHIVHTNNNYDRTAGAFAAWRANIPHVTNVHSFHSIQHNLTHLVRNRFATDHFLVDGVCVKELLERKDRITSKKISVVYLGVDPHSMIHNVEQRNAIRTEFQLRDNELVIGNVARMVPFKGHTFLLRAFAEVLAKFPQTKLVLVGDGELRNELEQEATTLGIRQYVLFTGFRDDLPALYSAFDVYVHPSVEGGGETFPFAVLQALSQELPVVVTRVGDVAQDVREGVNGFVVPDRNAKVLAEKMMMLAEYNLLREKMGKESRKYLLGRFTTSHMVQAIEGIYQKVLRQL